MNVSETVPKWSGGNTKPLTCPMDKTKDILKCEYCDKEFKLKKYLKVHNKKCNHTTIDSMDKFEEKDEFRSRNFLFTSFDIENPPIFIDDDMDYLAYGIEICPNTGKKHFQSFICLKSKITWKAFKKYRKNWLNIDCWFNIIKGTLKQNKIYCSKDGEYTEFGKLPKQGERIDLIEIKNNLVNGNITLNELMINEPYTYHQYGRTLRDIDELLISKKYRNWKPNVLWLYGKSGIGKTKLSKALLNDNYYNYKHENNYWNDYNGEENILLNEYRGDLSLRDFARFRSDLSIRSQGYFIDFGFGLGQFCFTMTF